MAKVLVVDDSETVRSEVSNFLTSQGISVSTAEDGLIGIKAIKSDAELKLVLCDINMPNMDGLTMVEKVREIEEGRRLSIIMLTTERSKTMVERGKKAGIKGWIVKPFNGNNALNGIQKLIAAN